MREAAARIKAGFLGKLKEVHVWTNRPVWPQGLPRPKGEDVPAHVHWEQFIGPANASLQRCLPPLQVARLLGLRNRRSGRYGLPYHEHAVRWLRTGQSNRRQGDHIGPQQRNLSRLVDHRVRFCSTENRPQIKVFWYDGGKKADAKLLAGKWKSGSGVKEFTEIKNSGSLIVGEKGKIFSPDDYGAEYYWQTDSEPMEVEFERSPGHFKEWVNAIKTGKPAWSNFQEYAGKLTEVILLGNLAVWAAGESKGDGSPVESAKLEWDQANLKIKGTDAYDSLIKPTYRDGYSV